MEEKRLIWNGEVFMTPEDLRDLEIDKSKVNKNKSKRNKSKLKEWSVNTLKDYRAKNQKGICK